MKECEDQRGRKEGRSLTFPENWAIVCMTTDGIPCEPLLEGKFPWNPSFAICEREQESPRDFFVAIFACPAAGVVSPKSCPVFQRDNGDCSVDVVAHSVKDRVFVAVHRRVVEEAGLSEGIIEDFES